MTAPIRFASADDVALRDASPSPCPDPSETSTVPTETVHSSDSETTSGTHSPASVAAPSPAPDVTPSPLCDHQRPNGARCRSFARRGSEFCYWHDPETAVERGAEPPAQPDPLLGDIGELKTGADLYRLLEEAARYVVAASRPDLQRLKTLNVLASTLLRAIHVKELEVEVAALRAEVVEKDAETTRLWKEKEKYRYELDQERKDCSKWFQERNKLRSYVRSTGFDPDSLPEEWMVNGRSVFEQPP
jgi:hypothetical protein